MRKILLSSVAATALLVGAENARADDSWMERNWYATLFSGAGFPEEVGMTHDGTTYNTDLKTGFTLGAAIGTELAPGLRGELEFSYQRYTADDYTFFAAQPPQFADGPANLYYLLANVWKDIDLGHRITPYVGAGLGVGIADINIEHQANNDPDLDDAGVGLAAQLGAGIRVPLYENISLDLSYRFKALLTATVLGDAGDQDEHGKMSFYSHLVQAGLVFDFGGPKASDIRALVAGEEPNWYVSLFGGATFPEDVGFEDFSSVYNYRMKDGFTIGGAVGTELADGLRGELEFSYVNYAANDYNALVFLPNVPSTGDVDLYFILANLWKDIDLGHNLTPYVGGGIGVGLVTTDVDGFFEKSDVEIGFAGQFGAGVRYSLGGPWTVDAGYRFKGIVDVTLHGRDAIFKAHEKASFYSHNLQLGATYNFGTGSQIEPAGNDDPAGQDWYVSLFGGGVVAEDSGITNFAEVYNVTFDAGFTVGVAVGTEVADGLRGELEASYVSYAADDYTTDRQPPDFPASGDADLYFILANLWKDFDLGNGIAPYVGGGLGIGIADVDIQAGPPLDDTAVALAGQLGAGLRFKITENLTADAGYRFKGLLDATIRADRAIGGPHGKASFYSHSFIGGLSYGF